MKTALFALNSERCTIADQRKGCEMNRALSDLEDKDVDVAAVVRSQDSPALVPMRPNAETAIVRTLNLVARNARIFAFFISVPMDASMSRVREMTRFFHGSFAMFSKATTAQPPML